MARSRNQQSSPLIKDLLAYRFHRVANQLSASAAIRYRSAFKVSLGEWRTLALLGAQAPLSLGELARAASLDKGQMSRVVTGLVARRLVVRAVDDRDARGVQIALTRSGQKLYADLIRAARERNARLLAALSAGERAALASILQKLDTEARAMLRDEQARGRRSGRLSEAPHASPRRRSA
ncbi:MAG: MarR family transcriptional regulator [Vicinamibacterales bacterium]